MHKLAGVVVLLAAARFFDANAQSDLADCAARLEGDDAEVVAACPDIAAVIAASPFAEVALHDGLPSHADIDAFHRLTSAYAEPRGAPTPDSAKLDGILAGLEVKKEPKSLWQLFNEWLADRWRDLVKRFPSL